jgi:hypothetical protein
MQQKTILWAIAVLISIASISDQAHSLTAAQRIQNRLAEVRGYRVIDREKRLSQKQFSDFGYVAPGNSAQAIHSRFGLPHGTNGTNEEYYPVVTTDQTFWVAAQYRGSGQTYTGYRFVRPQYRLSQIATPQTATTPYSSGSGSGNYRPWSYTPKYSQRTDTQRRWAAQR